jgi:CRISPR-associated protein Cmr3
MMHLFLEPLDVWLFRDGRPFDAGSDHRARSLFPPYPSVIQGAIRSHHLVVRGVDLRNPAAIAEAVGTADDVRGLCLRGPFVARREQGRIVRYLPQPADAVPVQAELPALRPASPPRAPDTGTLVGAPTPYLLGLDDEPAKGAERVWLAEESLARYLGGEEVTGIPETALFVREGRFGIALEGGRRTTREGALYEVEFICPHQDVGLLVEVDGYDGWREEGTLRLGGEGHGALYSRVEPHPWPAPPASLPARFKLYFATPAYFTGGWQPAGGTWGAFFEGSVRLVAAAVPRYESIGGFDLAGNRHKPARRYVPAGSVYYFECERPGGARLRPELVQGAVTQAGAEIGFGQVIVKEW